MFLVRKSHKDILGSNTHFLSVPYLSFSKAVSLFDYTKEEQLFVDLPCSLERNTKQIGGISAGQEVFTSQCFLTHDRMNVSQQGLIGGETLDHRTLKGFVQDTVK